MGTQDPGMYTWRGTLGTLDPEGYTGCGTLETQDPEMYTWHGTLGTQDPEMYTWRGTLGTQDSELYTWCGTLRILDLDFFPWHMSVGNAVCHFRQRDIGEGGETWYNFCEMLYISESIVIEDKNLVLFDSLNISLVDHVIIFGKVETTCA